MNRNLKWVACALAGLIAPWVAIANDGSIGYVAGGLVLLQNKDIDMVSEDLFISEKQVRVRYVFRNRAPHDVRITVGFPMPDFDLSDRGEYDFPSNFHTSVAGRPVVAKMERHVLLKGKDYSAFLRGLHIPLGSGAEEDIERITDALMALPKARREQLERIGLVQWDEWEEKGRSRSLLVPIWIVRDIWYWQQTFPAGRDLVVNHQYRPGVGGGVSVFIPDKYYTETYCVDADFLAGFKRLTRTNEFGYSLHDMGYILKTGGNWRSPIGDFRLVVDKGDPRNIISFCGEGVRKISPTQFEVRHRNWRPDRDLDILIIHPEP
jgi:hypothetical protein